MPQKSYRVHAYYMEGIQQLLYFQQDNLIPLYVKLGCINAPLIRNYSLIWYITFRKLLTNSL